MTRKLSTIALAVLVLAAGVALIVVGLQDRPTIIHIPNRHTHSAVYYPSTKPVRHV